MKLYQLSATVDLFTEPLEEFRNGQWIDEKKWADYSHHPLRVVLPLKDPNDCVIGENVVTLPNTKCQATVIDKDTFSLVGERLLPEGSVVNLIDMTSHLVCNATWPTFLQDVIVSICLRSTMIV